MSNYYHPKDNCVFLHGCYIPETATQTGNDAVIACIQDLTDGSLHLHMIKNPQIQLYVLREGLQTFEHKREYVRISDCDMYNIPYKNRYTELAERLQKRRAPLQPYLCKKIVEQSPYTFGWDIDPLIRMKIEYMENTPKDPVHLPIDIVDIETSVMNDNKDEILALSVCDWPTRTVHCFILNDTWLRAENTDALYERSKTAYQEFVDGLNDKATSIWNEQPVKPIYYLCHTERELIQKAFECIHKCRPALLGVWNMGFDIPRIIKRATYRQLDVVELFNYPEVPKEFHYFKWNEDRTKVDHFTDVWHTVDCPGFTYYYDAMCLYSRLRKVQGRESEYTLEHIANIIIGSGKMKFGTNKTHYMMQTCDPVGYCVYNTLDTIIPAMINAVADDVASMCALSDCSMLNDFSKQTVQLKAQFYRYLKDIGRVPGSCSGSMIQPYDEVIGNIGGAVLSPTLQKYRGQKILKEVDRPTSVYKLAADLDVSSFYPSATIAFNVSRETKLATTLWISGCPYTIQEIMNEESHDAQKKMAKANAEYINGFFSLVPCAEENAVYLGKTHFNLPDYGEMLEEFKRYKKL